ncbi:MAG: FtsL-like putative cell division protein [Bacteroidota bacterium]
MAKKKLTPKEPLSGVAAKWILSNLTFVFFLAALVTIYIANTHYSEKNIREIQLLQDEVDRSRWLYYSLKSDLMKKTKQSEVQEAVKTKGLSNRGKHPIKIAVKEE